MPSIHDIVHKLFEDFQGKHNRPPEDGKNFDSTTPQDPSDRVKDDDVISSAAKLFTDPFAAHNLFEIQMKEFNDLLKSLTFDIEDIFAHDPFNPSTIQEPTFEGKNPREHWLKHGFGKDDYFKKDTYESPDFRSGLDMDIFLPPSSPQDKHSQLQPRVFSSFSSVTRKTVRLPDGTMKTEEIIRKPDGTEERIESETLPDGKPSQGFDFINPRFGFSDFFNVPKLFDPEPKTKIVLPDPRDQLLKPGYETLNSNEEKVDKDLDSQVEQSGLPYSDESLTKQPNDQSSFKSVTKKTVTLPNGVKESEEIVRNSDGTQCRTVTQTLPDGTTTTVKASDSSQTGSDASVEIEKNIEVSRSFPFKGIKDFVDKMFK